LAKTSPQFAAVAFAVLTNSARAQPKWSNVPAAGEAALMPDYCCAKMRTSAYQQRNQRMGPDKFAHLQHC
jgi:hypothetical protein